jgi:hypothetical protein
VVVSDNPPKTLFQGKSQVLGPGLLGLLGLNVTETEHRLLCSPTPITQGFDSLVFDLPPQARVEEAVARTTGGGIELAFYSSSCTLLGRFTPEQAAAGVRLPAGVRYAVLANRGSSATEAGLTVTDR